MKLNGLGFNFRWLEEAGQELWVQNVQGEVEEWLKLEGESLKLEGNDTKWKGNHSS